MASKFTVTLLPQAPGCQDYMRASLHWAHPSPHWAQQWGYNVHARVGGNVGVRFYLRDGGELGR